MSDSEILRETLIDLERARRTEREFRLQTEGLLQGLEILGSIENNAEMFAGLFEILRDLLGFEDAFVFTGSDTDKMTLVAATRDDVEDLEWCGQELTHQALRGDPVAVFNTAMIAEWQTLRAHRTLPATSALHIGLRREPRASLMVCTHSKPAFFSSTHINLARRFGLLATQALLNRDLRELKLQAFQRSIRDQFFNASDDQMCIIDDSGTILQTNPAMEQGLRYEGDSLQDIAFLSLVHAEDQALVEQHLAQIGSAKKTTGFDAKFSTPSGDLCWLQWTLSFDPDGQIIYGAGRDITEQKKADDALHLLNEELREARDEALRANKAKSTFLAKMSHELRTPLNAIIGYSEMVIEEIQIDGSDKYIADIQRIGFAGKHLLSIICQVLDLSKIEAEKMQVHRETFSLDELIDEVMATVRPLMNKNNNKFELVYDKTIDELITDATKTRQILFNLLSNAAKFTENGTIVLEVTSQKVEWGDQISFAVKDTGLGMTPEELEQIFDAFSQADNSTTRAVDGTGLGLAITRHLCRILGGSIDVESTLNKGSIFTARLPRVLPEGSIKEFQEQKNARGSNSSRIKGQTASAHVGNAAGREERCILVIDDDPDLHTIIESALSAADYGFAPAYDGAQGLHLAYKLSPLAIVLDIELPVLDGWEVLRRLKEMEKLKHIPVIVLTMVDDRKKARALGADHFILKPFDRQKFISILDSY